MVKNMLCLILMLFLFFSCYSQKIVLNSDKNSGQMIIEYNLTDDTFQLLSFAFYEFASEENEFDPEILIDSDLFKEAFKQTDDIKLKSINIDNSNGYKGKIVIEFKNLNKILDEIPKGLTNLQIDRKGNTLTISQTLNIKELDKEGRLKSFILEQKEDDINFYNYLTKTAKFEFTIKSSHVIKKAEGIILSKNKKEASYSFKINDIIENENKILKFLITIWYNFKIIN